MKAGILDINGRRTATFKRGRMESGTVLSEAKKKHAVKFNATAANQREWEGRQNADCSEEPPF